MVNILLLYVRCFISFELLIIQNVHQMVSHLFVYIIILIYLCPQNKNVSHEKAICLWNIGEGREFHRQGVGNEASLLEF